tara:strand:- start:110 stop:697 length:588 start_codon:yes stop_codon:yes gene_type:complete
MKKPRGFLTKDMEEKYIKFYKTFDKRFKNKGKSNSLFELNQSQLNKNDRRSEMKNKHMDINLKKLLIFPLTLFLFVSCSESNINMTLVCDLTEVKPKQEKSTFDGWIDDREFIWYKSNNSLQSSFGNVTPYFSENDFEITFKRYAGHDDNFEEKDLLKLGELFRKIEYNKLTHRLKLTEYREKVLFMDYDCKRLN